MVHFIRGFEKKALSKATLGAGIGLGAGYASAKKEVEVSNLKEDSLPQSKSLKDFTKQLIPGDVIYMGGKKDDAFQDFGYHIIPRLGGNMNFHSMVYTGKGKVIDVSRDREDGKTKEILLSDKITGLRQKDYTQIAYRPIGLSPEDMQRAADRARKLIGSKYPTNQGLALKGIKTLLGIPGKKDDITSEADDIVCQDSAIKAYPNIFKKRHLTSAEMQYNKQFTPVAKTGKYDYNREERAVANAVYPLAKSIRGALRGGVAGGFLDLIHK